MRSITVHAHRVHRVHRAHRAHRCRRTGGRIRPVADAAVAALVAAGGLVLAGAVTADPEGAPGGAPNAAVEHRASSAPSAGGADGAGGHHARNLPR